MKKVVMLALFAGLATLGVSLPVSAQSLPDVHGLHAFSAETNFMSVTGYFRWQYFLENQEWISRAEAESLVKTQIESTPTTPTP